MSTVSVVIPAYNESECIGRTLAAVYAQIPADRLADVVVCDHGSTDDTVAIAEQAGATVHTWRDGTIAAQRNRGAERTRGALLLFLDADTELTDAWGAALDDVIAALEADPTLLTGAHVVPPEPGSWLERNWFAPLAADASSRHLGSAHILMSRAHFDAIGGFDASLETGEDFDLCVRAAAAGSAVVNDTRLRAIHHDFPQTASAFVRRERWHGRGNFASLDAFRSSPVGLATAAFTGLHLVGAAAALTGRRRLALGCGVGVAGLCVAASAHKFRRAGARQVLSSAPVFYLYFAGRSLALTDVLEARLLTESDGE